MFKLVVLFSVVACALGASIPSGLLPQLDGRIIGGSTADISNFKYIVSLQQASSHFCGGSIISATSILTAAHCVKGATASSLSIRVGSASRSSGGTTAKVSSYTIHPSYNANTMVNDVAIVKLSSTLTLSGNIAKIGLSGSTPTAGTNAVVAGWGTTTSGGSSLPTNLLYVTVQIVSKSSCVSAYGNSNTMNTMLCASATGKDSCQGDSGGPLVADTVQVGVVSWGKGCATAGYPGVYANVADLKTWITNNS